MTADEMFEKIGYKKHDNHPDDEKQEDNMWTTQDCRVIEYIQSGEIKGIVYTLFIRFHIVGKRIECGASEKTSISKFPRVINPVFNMQELNAINQKVKELGW